jgi:hypothetical protein
MIPAIGVHDRRCGREIQPGPQITKMKSPRRFSKEQFMRSKRATRMIGSVAALIAAVTLAILALPSAAQPAASVGTHYDKTHELTLNGTISNVISQTAAGVPAGLHLVVSGPQGTVDAHLGPYVSRDTREALHSGLPVQVVGSMAMFQGKQYLLARQVIFSGRQVTVRSAEGFLLLGQPNSAHHAAAKKSELNGGAR